MKKYLILAAAALAASAACTKSEVAETPQQTIAFEVARYSTATKAAAYNSLLDEQAGGAAVTSFTTNAWFHPAAGSVQQYMADQAVVPDNTTDPTQWAPDGRTYYWPKTGYINFFSYAGTPAPTAKAENSLTYTGVTVDRNANILVADAAYGYSENLASATPYGQNSVTKGVPTLFHHVLAKVRFDVVFDASGTEADYAWTDEITAASITVPSVGTLALSFAEQSTQGTVPFTTAGWTALGTDLVIDGTAVTLTAKGGNKSDGSTTDGTATGAPKELIAASTVIPHTLGTGVTFSMTHTMTYKYKTETPITETVTVGPTQLKTFTPTLDAWKMNTIYTYHIIIKPGGEILFDPAVETWVEENGPTYTYND